MPVGEIAGELLSFLGRILMQFFVEIVFEILVKGVGFLIVRPFNRNINPDSALVIVVGIMFWLSLIGGLWIGYQGIPAGAT